MINAQSHRAFTADALAAVQAVAAKHGLDVKLQGGNYNAERSLVTLVASPSDMSAVEIKRALEFSINCRQYGLEPEDYGCVFHIGSVAYRLTGISNSRPKNPLSFTRMRDGSAFKGGTDLIANIKVGIRKPLPNAPKVETVAPPVAPPINLKTTHIPDQYAHHAAF